MTKQKVLAVAGVLGIAALVLSAGTLAYFTDTETKTNTFTMGSVDIKLIEKQREIDANGDKTTNLVNFKQGKVLMPIVGSAQGEKDALGLPTAKNYVDKIATVKNVGKSDAWTRFYFAIPSKLDDGYESFNAGLNILHFNFGKDENGDSTDGVSWIWKHDGKWNYYETKIDGISYNVYYADYATKLAKSETTTPAVSGLYLDATLDTKANENGGVDYVVKNSGAEVVVDMADFITEKGFKIDTPVYAVAVQADGFADATSAINAAFGEKFNPWGGATDKWQ